MSDKEENANASSTPSNTNTTAATTVAAQLGKLRDANLKYKNLLKLAKERIQQQEDDLKKLKSKSQCTNKVIVSLEKTRHICLTSNIQTDTLLLRFPFYASLSLVRCLCDINNTTNLKNINLQKQKS